MSHTHAAERAEARQSGSKILRITEAAFGVAARAQRRIDIALTSEFRKSIAWSRTAWCWYQKKRSQQIESKRLRVEETISLGEKRTVSIVTVDRAQYLIGSSAGGVQLLTRLDQTSRNEVSS